MCSMSGQEGSRVPGGGHFCCTPMENQFENIGFCGLAGIYGVLDPPLAGPPAASQPGCSLFVPAGVAAQ